MRGWGGIHHRLETLEYSEDTDQVAILMWKLNQKPSQPTRSVHSPPRGHIRIEVEFREEDRESSHDYDFL